MVTCVYRYSRDLRGTLWPRFRHILELNVTSVHDTNPSKLAHIDTSPHYVSHTHTQCYIFLMIYCCLDH